MLKIKKRRSTKSGLPPGTLVHIGEARTSKVSISLLHYDEMEIEEKEGLSAEDCFPYKDKPAVTWLKVNGIHDTALIEKIGTHFGLHPLTLEDIVNTSQRPKVEFFDDYVYVVLNVFYPVENSNEIKSEQVSIIFNSNCVISFHEGNGNHLFKGLLERIVSGKGRIRKKGADYLVYSLIDAIVDNYFIVLEKNEERIEQVEEILVTNPTSETLENIHNLKSEMIMFRKSIWPLRELISRMQREESPLIEEATDIYLRDVYDHVIQIIDTIETYRDILAGMLDIYLSSVSNRMNEVMKVLTIIATIFIPLTFIAGVYGMNFKYMPELDWHLGYFFAWGIMIGVGVIMLAYFRKKKWL